MLLNVRFSRIQNCFQLDVGNPVLTGFFGFLVKLSLESSNDVVQVTGARFDGFGKAFCFSGFGTVFSDISITVQLGLSVNKKNPY